MIKPVKQWLRRRFPDALAAYHNYSVTRELRSHRMQLTPFGFRFAGHTGMEQGTFEPDEVRLVQAFARPGAVFVDVGANYGYFVCLARQAGAHVVAIEPLAMNLGLLYNNLEANGWRDVEVLPVGLAGSPGIATLYGGGTAASLVPLWSGTSTVFKHQIALSTLDTLIGSRFAGQPMMIKIDVEGAELGVLRGAAATLARDPAPAWLVEISLTENHPEGFNRDFQTTFDLFRQHGYRAITVGSDPREVTAADVARWVAARSRDFGGINFLFEK